jgi:ABC-type uncharacterized transport system permease subunit
MKRIRNRVQVLEVILGAALLVAMIVGAFFATSADAAQGNEVGRNLGGLLRQIAIPIYGGILAIVGLVFLINRKYQEVVVFLIAAVAVGWFVFTPEQLGQTARAIGERVLGG